MRISGDKLGIDGGEMREIKECPKCGQAMYWWEPWKRYICYSWWYMEGGCKTW